MADFSVQIDGVEDALIKAARYNIEIENEVKGVIKKSANNVKKQARENVLVRTGLLKRSITVKDTSRRVGVPKGFAKTVHSRSKLGGTRGHLVEGGTGPRTGPDHPKFGADRGRMPRTPFMSSARIAEEPNFRLALRRITERYEII